MKWETIRLDEAATISKGRKHSETDMNNGSRYLQIDDLHGHGNFKYTNEQGNHCTPNDVLIAWDGANAGKVGTGLSGMVGSTLAKITITNNRLSSRYLFWFLESKFEEIKSKRTGATIPHINGGELRSMGIPLPPLQIQEQIADTLDKADALRKKDQLLLQKYDELAQAVFYDMFGDPVKNEKGWEVKKLSELSEIIMGQSPSGDTYNENGHGEPLLNGPTEFGETYPKEKQWTTAPTKFCKENDILFCVRGATAGRMNIADKPYCIGRGLAAIRPKTKSQFSFIHLYLQNMYNIFQKTSNGSTFINISGDQLKGLLLPILPNDQLVLFQKLSELKDKAVSKIKEASTESEKLFSSLLSDYFI